MIEFEIRACGLYQPGQLVIDYHPERRMPITPEVQAWMNRLWEQKLALAQANHTLLFDAPLFRLVEAAPLPGGLLHLVLGDTSYKEYVTTREPSFFQGRTRGELGNALAVCSVVETSDGYILLDKRQGVDGYAGRYHVIGGFFERHLDMDTHLPDPFAAMRREIREETGIQHGDLLDQHCLGLVYDLTMPHGELGFLTRLRISREEALAREPEEDEIKELLTLQVTAESLRDFILCHHGNISPTGEPNLIMYGGWKFGEEWFEDVMRHI